MKAFRTVIGLLVFLSLGWLTGCQSPASSSNPDFSEQFPLIYQFYQNDALENTGTLKLFSSNEIKNSPWGIQFNLLPPHVDKYPSDFHTDTLLDDLSVLLDRVTALGVKWARVSVNWSTIEDRHGNYHWAYLDSLIAGLSKAGIEPYVCLNGGHKTYTDELPPTVSELGMQSWLSFVKLMADRYANKVDYWEIWNEPNYPSFWKPEPDAEKYVELVKETVFTIREYDQDAVILGGSLARMDLPYAQKIFGAGIGEYIDVLTVHPYNAIPTGSVRKIGYPVKTPDYYLPSSHQYKDFYQLLEKYHSDIEIWQAECGYPSAQNSHGWTGTGPWGENIQAKWLLRRMIADVSQKVNVSAYFSMWEYKLNPDERTTNRKGLLKLEDMAPKQAFDTYRNLIALFKSDEIDVRETDSHFQINRTASFPGIWEENIQSWNLTVEGNYFFCYWLPWRMAEFVNPAETDLKLKLPSMKDPVLVDLLTGYVYNIENMNLDGDFKVLQSLPLTDYPLVVTERSSIIIQ